MTHLLGPITETWFWRYFFSHLGWVDWMLLGFLLAGILFGLRHGVSVELPRTLEILIALYVTFESHPLLADWLVRETPWTESYAQAFTFTLVMGLSWLSLRLLFEILGKFVRLEVAAPFGTIGGLLMGLARYFLFFSVISYGLVMFPLEWIHRSYQAQSWSGQTVAQVPAKIYHWVKELKFQWGPS